ncbi:MAG: hypothetical protein IKQ49_05510 [Eubacterium sp.]|jgi:hypothetical protein|nr:hypothetical protein [Eubacterium sp.]MBR6172611.1 hypothetical protein [Eubacterium sp.]
MGLDDRLFRELKKNEKAAADRDQYYAEEPDWMIYEKRDREKPLNEYKGVYEVTDERSINTAPSVFEKGTIFRTGKK